MESSFLAPAMITMKIWLSAISLKKLLSSLTTSRGYGSNGITVCIILFTMLRMELRMLFAFGAIPANIRSQR